MKANKWLLGVTVLLAVVLLLALVGCGDVNTKECDNCGEENAEDAKFCGFCGETLSNTVICDACGKANDASIRYCDECGWNLRKNDLDFEDEDSLIIATDTSSITEATPDTIDPITVAFEIKDYGKITLELYPNEAPISVENFVNYVESGFYDGLIFHRVIEDFLIQGGDPTGTGSGDPSLEKIKGEFSANGVENNLKFERGVIGMARANDYNSASSQFFIMHKTTSSLDGMYAAFGKVISGMDVVDAIATCEKTNVVDGSGNKYIPATDIIIERAYVIE